MTTPPRDLETARRLAVEASLAASGADGSPTVGDLMSAVEPRTCGKVAGGQRPDRRVTS